MVILLARAKSQRVITGPGTGEFLENVDKFEPQVCLGFLIPKGDVFAYLDFRDRHDFFFICSDRFCCSLCFQRGYHFLRVPI